VAIAGCAPRGFRLGATDARAFGMYLMPLTDLSARYALEAARVMLIDEHGGAGADVRLRKPQRKRA
jgi:hypothetical protein